MSLCRVAFNHGVPAHPNKLRDHAALTYGFFLTGNQWKLSEADGDHWIHPSWQLCANNAEVLRDAAVKGRIAAEVHRGRGLARRQTADRSRRLQGARSNALCNLPADAASRGKGAFAHRFSGRGVQRGSGSAKSMSKVIEGAEVHDSMFEVWRHWWVTAVCGLG